MKTNTMQTKLQQQIAFYLTGHRDGPLRAVDGAYRPALFACYNDLSSLRYDMPLVLDREATPDGALLSLSELVDNLLEAMAEIPERDRVARHGYRIEREIRQFLTASGPVDLTATWDAAVGRLAAKDPLLVDSAKRLWGQFRVEGTLVDADAEMPNVVISHLWCRVQATKAAAFKGRAERLLQKLRDILEAEFTGSAAGRLPQRLRAAVGASFAGTFDFDAMSRILDVAKPGFGLSDERRSRIQGLIRDLEDQRFYALEPGGPEPYSFEFNRCSEALDAYRARRDEAVRLVKALAVAESESTGEYRAGIHDIIFESFGTNGLDAEQLAQLPDYLVCVKADDLDPAESAQIVELLSSGLPIKVLVCTDDVLRQPPVAEGHLALGSRAHQLVHTAIGLTDVFVLQTSSSCLLRDRDRLLEGLTYDGPALFSVFSGAGGHAGDIPDYLVSAAAMEARVFPSMVFGPRAGGDQASGMQIDHNPQAGVDWPVHEIAYEDDALQAGSQETAFTLADFVVMDERFAEHYAVVNKDDWTPEMVTVADALRSETKSVPDEVPYVTLVDNQGQLFRAIIDGRLFRETRRCLAMWNRLQDLGGVHNSFAELPEPVAPDKAEANVPATASAGHDSTAAVPEPDEGDVHGDDAYIETARCTTCNECTNLNNRMFAYNSEKQAYIADPDAGTFRDLVEAAEGCQVSIIHPGKPRNLKEPGLDDLIRRASDFN